MERDPVPQFPIAKILEALGFTDVPVVSGGYAKVACYFHGDRTPSASVSRYGFKCFSCGRSGDGLKLLAEEEGLSFANALKRAEEICGSGDRQAPRKSGWGQGLLG